MKKSLKQNQLIEGVEVVPLKKIPDVRGTIMHGVRSDTMLNPFGEIYFKKLYGGIINGWHVHETMILNYICIFGMMKIVLYDTRKKSKTCKVIQEVYFGDDNYCLVHVPPGIANAMQSLVLPFSIFCNVASEPHNSAIKYKRIDPYSGEIPYDWSKKDF